MALIPFFHSGEKTFTCLQKSSSPVFSLIQSRQNAIKRELEHRAQAPYGRRARKKYRVQLKTWEYLIEMWECYHNRLPCIATVTGCQKKKSPHPNYKKWEGHRKRVEDILHLAYLFSPAVDNTLCPCFWLLTFCLSWKGVTRSKSYRILEAVGYWQQMDRITSLLLLLEHVYWISSIPLPFPLPLLSPESP